MSKKVLVSLVSFETIPNVELINEFRKEIDQYIFVHTKQTALHTQWIIDSTGIDGEKIDTFEIEPFDIADIEQKLKSYDFGDNDYILNITGGTKLMILAFQEFFKNVGARIYYVTGHDLNYVKVFPVLGERNFKFAKKLLLEEYLTSYGFEFKAGKCLNDEKQSNIIFHYFLGWSVDQLQPVLDKLRAGRSKNFDITNEKDIKDFLTDIPFVPANQQKLNKYENRYLSGNWFEEYVFYRVKRELDLSDSEIGTGYNIKKQGTPNEMDVLFTYKHKLYIIECKTSIFEGQLATDGSLRQKNLLNETINKSDSLRNKFGLFAQTFLFTLEDMKDAEGKPRPRFETHFKRAGLSRVQLITRREIESGKSMKELLNIK